MPSRKGLEEVRRWVEPCWSHRGSVLFNILVPTGTEIGRPGMSVRSGEVCGKLASNAFGPPGWASLELHHIDVILPERCEPKLCTRGSRVRWAVKIHGTWIRIAVCFCFFAVFNAWFALVTCVEQVPRASGSVWWFLGVDLNAWRSCTGVTPMLWCVVGRYSSLSVCQGLCVCEGVGGFVLPAVRCALFTPFYLFSF